MQSRVFKFILAVLVATFASTSFAGGKVYGETEFLDRFGGRSKKMIIEKLGKPAKKNLSVRPSNASSVVGKPLKNKNKKPVKVEMWYYKNIVKYDDKHTYKETEITFVNDRVMNISFFNNR